GQNDILEQLGLADLVIGRDRERRLRGVERALGGIGCRGNQGRAHLFEGKACSGELGRVHLNPDRWLAVATDRNAGDARHLRDCRDPEVAGLVLNLRERLRLRAHREGEDRRIGRIDLPIRRGRRHRLRERPAGSGDRRLHVLGRQIDVTIKIELNDNLGCAERAERGELGHTGYLRELTLERGGDCGRHGLCARPCKRRLNLDRRKIDLRQGRDRQERKCRDAGKRDRRHQQRGGDRAADERLGEVHLTLPASADCGVVKLTGALRASRYCPSVTTRSPSRRPEVTTVRSPDVGPTSIARGSAVLLAATIHANKPRGPRWMAGEGTASTLYCVSMSRRALTKSPGHSRSSSFGNIALRRMVEVAWSIALSMSRSLPEASARRLFWS